MKNLFARILTVFFLAAILTSPVIAQSSGRAYVRIVHLAPFAEDTGVTVNLDGEDILTEFDYGDSTMYLELRPGNHNIEITPTGETDPVITTTINVARPTDYTAVVIGDDVNQGLDFILLEGDNTAPTVGTFKLRLGHFAPFADTLAGTTVDVRTDEDTMILLDDVVFGEVDAYIELLLGTYDLKITTADGSKILVNLAPITVTNGQILSIFFVGDGTSHPLTGYCLPSDALGYFLPLESLGARLRFVHLAPFAVPGTVDISMNGVPVPALQNIGYGDSTPYFHVPEANYQMDIFLDDTDTVVISKMIYLGADNAYTAIAIGDEETGETTLGLRLLEDDNTAPTPGNFKLRLGHLAPLADTLAGTLADVRTDDDSEILLNDVMFDDVETYVELPEGTYDLKITTWDGATTLINLAPVTFSEGQIFSAFAVGNDTIQPLGGYALPANEEGDFMAVDMARLQVAHLAPFASPGTVDIKLNGATALSNLSYGDSTAYINLPAITYLVDVVPNGSTEAAITETVDLTDGGDYTAIATGDGGNQPLALKVLLDDNTPPTTGNFRLRLGHLAPFANTLEGTRADVRYDDGTLILGGVKFGDVAGYLELPAGTYDLQITTVGGDTTLIDLAPVTFTDGQILSAFAVGNGTIQPLGGYALPSNDMGFFLPLEEEGFMFFFPLLCN